MGIKQYLTRLAKTPQPETRIEIGTSTVGTLPSIFNDEFIDPDAIQVDDFKRMLDYDPTIQALYSTITMPLLGAAWTIEPEDETPEAIMQSEWVENMLRLPPHKGGMTTPLELVLAQALRAIVEGYAAFEKVYDLYDGRIVFRKIAWRDPTTLTIKTDARGGFNGLKQRAYINSSYSEVEIPLERCWLYTYGKEFHHLKGRSAFTSAYVAYDKKRRLMYLAEQQAQSDALKLKIVKGSEFSSQDELDATTEAVDEVGFKATVGLPYGYDVNTLNNNGGMDLLPLIEFQNAEMARSVLAMFILLGTGSKTGAYALSQDQSDFFVQALSSIRRSLEQHITSYLIPDLYFYNFATPKYGTFKFADLTDSTVELLQQSFLKIIEKDRLPDEMVAGVVQKIADKLDIDADVTEESIPEAEEPEVSQNTIEHALVELSGWRRELTEAEQKVNFDGINRKLDTLESQLESELKPVYDQLSADALLKLDKIIEDGRYEKITVKDILDENLRNQYVRVLRDYSMEAYLYGKASASEEIDVKIPATPKTSKDFFRDNAEMVAEKQFADLIFQIQSEVGKARRKDQLSKTMLASGDIIGILRALFVSYYDDKIGATATTAVSVGVNRGRKDVFEQAKNDIYAYQYSAILDSRTCPTCLELDGKVLNEQQYKQTKFDPPIHMRCRCLWVAILNDELDPPAITGFPDRPGGILEPSLSDKTREEIKELGRQAVEAEIQRLLEEG